MAGGARRRDRWNAAGRIARAAGLILAAATFGSRLPAADRFWSGTGTWDTTAQNWGTTSGGPYDAAAWNNAAVDSAIFQGTAGSVTVGTGVTAAGLSFTTTGYTLTGGTITLGGGRQISVASGVAATINSAWAGTGSTTGISGGGTLTVGASMSIGTLAADTTLIVNGGTVTAARASGTPAVPIAGRLQINTGGQFTNAGSAFHVFGNPTPTNHPGIWINGGTLSASGGAYYVPSGASASSPGVTMTGGLWEGSDVRVNGNSGGQATAYIQTLPTTTTAVISAALRSFGGGTHRYDVASGSVTGGTYPGVDLAVTGATGPVFISGTTNVVKSGSGVMEFRVNQSFAGGLTVSQGTVWGLTSGAFGSGAVTINDAATGASNTSLFISADSSVTVANPITVAANGTGTVTIGGRSTSSSAANIFSGAFTLGRDVQLSAGNTSTRTTFSGSMSGAGGVTVTQGRVTYESTGKTYAGPTTVNSGAVLQLTGGELLPDAGAVTVNGNLRFAGGGTTTETIGGLSGGGTVEGSTVAGTYALVVSQSTVTAFSGTIINGQASTVISLTKSGTGRLSLSGANTYTGTTTVSGGVLQLNAATALPGGIGASGGTSGLTLAGGVVGLGVGDFSRGLGTGTSQVQWTGSGGFAAYGADRAVNLGGAAAEVTWGGGSFVPNGSALVLGAADATGAVDFRNPIDLGGASRTVQVVGGRAVLSGALRGTGGGLTKTGAGALTLTASNSYTAGTTVSEGVLGFASQASIPGWGAAGAVSVAAGASLAVGNDVDPQTAIDQGYLDPSSGLGFDTSAGDRTWATALPGGRSFVKTGANALTLTAAGAGAVPTTIYAGVLTLGVAENTGVSGPLGTSGTITFAGGTLRYSAANQFDYSARFSDAAGQPVAIDTAGQNVTYATGVAGTAATLTKAGSGRLTLTGANTYTGATTVSGGTLTIGAGGSLAAATTVSLANTAGAAFEVNGVNPTIAGLTGGGATGGNLVLTSGTLTVNKASGSDTFSGAVSGAGALVKTGAGTLRLAGGSNFSGGTTISAGTLELNVSTAAGNGTITINDAGTGASNTGLFISANATVTVANPIVVGAQGSGIVSLGGQSTSNAVANLYSGSIALGRDVRLSAGNTSTRTTFTGGMTGAGGVTVTQGRVTYESTAKTYAGPTTVNSGAVLQLTGANLLPNATPLTVNGALWFTSGGSSTTTVGSLAGSGSVQGHPDVPGTYGFIVSQSTDTTFSGTIVNGRVNTVVSLTKSGAGLLALAGANTYTGATTVSGGTLLVNGSIATSSLTTVESGGTLGGTGTVGATRITAGGFHSPGTSPGLQTITDGLQYDAGSTLTWELFANDTAGRGTAYDGINLTGGALAVDPGAILALDFGTTGEGSVVNWDDAFWGSDQSWTVIDISGTATWNGVVFGSLSIGTDTLGRSLQSVRPNAGFSVANVGDDLVLVYAAVPEPTTLALAGIGLVAAACAARRRRARRHAAT